MLILRRPVEPRGDRVVEGEGVEREPAAGAERRGDPLEDFALVRPRRQVQERAERADDEVDRLVERELAHVALAQLDGEPGGAVARDRQHRRRRVDADHALAGLACDWNRDPAAPDGELDDRLLGLARKRDVPGDVRGHVGGPVVVVFGPRVVRAHDAGH